MSSNSNNSNSNSNSNNNNNNNNNNSNRFVERHSAVASEVLAEQQYWTSEFLAWI